MPTSETITYPNTLFFDALVREINPVLTHVEVIALACPLSQPRRGRDNEAHRQHPGSGNRPTIFPALMGRPNDVRWRHRSASRPFRAGGFTTGQVPGPLGL